MPAGLPRDRPARVLQLHLCRVQRWLRSLDDLFRTEARRHCLRVRWRLAFSMQSISLLRRGAGPPSATSGRQPPAPVSLDFRARHSPVSATTGRVHRATPAAATRAALTQTAAPRRPTRSSHAPTASRRASCSPVLASQTCPARTCPLRRTRLGCATPAGRARSGENRCSASRFCCIDSPTPFCLGGTHRCSARSGAKTERRTCLTLLAVFPRTRRHSSFACRYAGNGERCLPCTPEVASLIPTVRGGFLARGVEATIFGAHGRGGRVCSCLISRPGNSICTRHSDCFFSLPGLIRSPFVPPPLSRAASVKTPARPVGVSDFTCNTSDLTRSLRWAGALAGGGGGVADFASSPAAVNLTDAGNFANTNALLIAPRSLPVGSTAVFTFTACYADAPPDPTLCGVASASLEVTSTPLVATLSGVNAIVGEFSSLIFVDLDRCTAWLSHFLARAQSCCSDTHASIAPTAERKA